MQNVGKSSKPQELKCWEEERAAIASHIKQGACSDFALNILEAGCGTEWGVDLEGVQYILTGVDTDKNALHIRKNQAKDLDIALHGDLRTVSLVEGHYDVIYNSNVLEHVRGAESVLKNFVRWLKPGGILILIFPNRNSVNGFLVRKTPFWFHILYNKYIKGDKNAGKSGYAPFPTFFDRVVSIRGMYEFCEEHGLVVRAEYSVGHGRNIRRIFRILSGVSIWIVHLASFRRLSVKYHDLLLMAL